LEDEKLAYLWTLRGILLDALKDDSESIIQILEYMDYLKMNFNIKMVKTELVRLLI
jgi:hypothetical protein